MFLRDDGNNIFSYKGCNFHVSSGTNAHSFAAAAEFVVVVFDCWSLPGKANTCRIVVWKEFGLLNSFTMEASFAVSFLLSSSPLPANPNVKWLAS